MAPRSICTAATAALLLFTVLGSAIAFPTPKCAQNMHLCLPYTLLGIEKAGLGRCCDVVRKLAEDKASFVTNFCGCIDTISSCLSGLNCASDGLTPQGINAAANLPKACGINLRCP